jgi:hypothetical protein
MPERKWNVNMLTIDNYVGNINKRIEKSSPSLRDIEGAIVALNSDNKSSLCVEGTDDSVFCVGGGPEGYHVSVTYTHGVYVLAELGKGEEEVQLVIGSVLTPLPAKYVVGQAAALNASRHYYSTGQLSPSLTWAKS